jgi:hypothetical protein
LQTLSNTSHDSTGENKLLSGISVVIFIIVLMFGDDPCILGSVSIFDKLFSLSGGKILFASIRIKAFYIGIRPID